MVRGERAMEIERFEDGECPCVMSNDVFHVTALGEEGKATCFIKSLVSKFSLTWGSLFTLFILIFHTFIREPSSNTLSFPCQKMVTSFTVWG
jgi:hypothetical protein